MTAVVFCLTLVQATAAQAEGAKVDRDRPDRPDKEVDERAQGRRHFEAGEQHFQRGEFPAALVEYEAGYRLTRLPGFLINIAHCHRLSGELRKARASYRKYLLVEPTSSRKGEVEEIIRKLDDAISDEDGTAAQDEAATKPLRTPSPKWWLWSALAASVVGSTVATMALAAQDKPPTR